MTKPRVTQEQLDILRHTVGLDKGTKPYRNHFAADPGHEDYDDLTELCTMGLMIKRQSPVSSDKLFHITDMGCWMLGLSGLGAIER